MVYNQEQISFKQENILNKVYFWMTTGLLITGITAFAGAYIPVLTQFLLKYWVPLFIIALIGQFVLVITLSTSIFRINYSTGLVLFSIYSFLMGITMFSIFRIYTLNSIIYTFFIAASMFASMAIYGFFTKADLSSWSNLLGMALWGLIIGLIINIFIGSSAFDTILSLIGVIVFAGLTAADVQKIKSLHAEMSDGENSNKISLFGALMLYLDFMNLFISLLRLTGRRQE